MLKRLVQAVRRHGLRNSLKLVPKNARNMLSYLGPGRWRLRKSLREFDRRFGVDTASFAEVAELGLPPEAAAQAVRYQPIVAIDTYLRPLAIPFEEYTFVDYGSGKGRALLMASEFPFREIIGVECAVSLIEIARDNVRKYNSPTQKCGKISVIEIDAAEFIPPSMATVYFLYNPFARPILERVLSQIRKAERTLKRANYLIYVDPQHRSCLAAAPEWKIIADYGSWIIYGSSTDAADDTVAAIDGAATV